MSLTRFTLIFSLFLSATLWIGCSAENEKSDRGEGPVSVAPEEEASRQDSPIEEPVAETRQEDDTEAITKIEDMYGEVFADEDGFVVTVDFGGALSLIHI